jgi:hypothetical protein
MAFLPRRYLLEVETLCQSRLPSPIAMGEGLGVRASGGNREALTQLSHTSSRMCSAPSTIIKKMGAATLTAPFPADD